jgi:hypothetical protein
MIALFVADWIPENGAPDVPEGMGYICKSYVPDATVLLWVYGSVEEIDAMKADTSRWLYLGDVAP